jgi:GNAT superfamily N-acetyltransferase
MAHGESYAEQFGWSVQFEQLVAGIVGDFARGNDPSTESMWVAEVDGQRVGSVALVASKVAGTATLRLLLVDPSARGLGVGRTLVSTAITFAQGAGYSAVDLWTTANLSAARRLYQSAGFVLVEESSFHGFGQVLTGQTWRRELHAAE